MTTKSLQLIQASLEHSDDVGLMRADLTYVFNTGADMIGVTELNSADRRSSARDLARSSGYLPIVFSNSETALFVLAKSNAAPLVKNRGNVFASAAIPGVQPDRYISWVHIRWWGRDIFFHESHWVRDAYKDPKFVASSERSTRAMITQVKKHGQNDNLSFFAGDLNVDNNNDDPNLPNHMFRDNGLLSIYDELHVNPKGTEGPGTYDVIGSYRPDQQVKGTRYKIYPKQNSDHSFVSAWYDVTVDAKKKKKHDPTPTDTGGTPDPIYATGGDIDWSDYTDDTIYPLPFAVDDSDMTAPG